MSYLFKFLTILAVIVTAECFNRSFIDLKGDFLRDEFLSGSSRIPSLPNLNLCNRQLLYISKNWKKLNVFPCKFSNALKKLIFNVKLFSTVIDSWAKIPPGLMTGNIWAFGNYDQCLAVNTKLPLPTLGTLEGKYCKALIPISKSNAEITGRADETQNLISKVGVNRESRESRGIAFALQSGICIPKSCKPEEVTALVGLPIVDCTFREDIPLEPLDYVAM